VVWHPFANAAVFNCLSQILELEQASWLKTALCFRFFIRK